MSEEKNIQCSHLGLNLERQILNAKNLGSVIKIWYHQVGSGIGNECKKLKAKLAEI